MEEAVLEIRKIFQRWLEGDLSQEDALFAIGDVLEHEQGQTPTGPSAVRPPGPSSAPEES